jgi:hypothetical protein
MSPADHLAVLAFEAALDCNARLWAELSRMEQEARPQSRFKTCPDGCPAGGNQSARRPTSQSP